MELQITPRDQALATAALMRGITVHQQWDPPRSKHGPIFRHEQALGDLETLRAKGLGTENLARAHPVLALAAAAEALGLEPVWPIPPGYHLLPADRYVAVVPLATIAKANVEARAVGTALLTGRLADARDHLNTLGQILDRIHGVKVNDPTAQPIGPGAGCPYTQEGSE